MTGRCRERLRKLVVVNVTRSSPAVSDRASSSEAIPYPFTPVGLGDTEILAHCTHFPRLET